MESGLYLVGTPIGNLDDITERAVATLREADVVYAEDTRRTGRLLAALGARTPLRSLHAHNEAERTEEILERLRRGERCALVSDAGTPAVSDPGRRVTAAVLEAGLRVVPVPGPSAVLAALSASGLPADLFAFLGFPPRGGRARKEWLSMVARSPVTVVAFESPRRLGRLLVDLEAVGLGGRIAVVAREMTKLHEEIRRGAVAELRERFSAGEVRGEVTLVVEGLPRAGGEEGASRAEAAAAARRLARAGHSTREIAEHLQQEFGVPRNEAYEVGLQAAEGPA